VRKALWILLALAALRLLPKAVRREARALELITLLFEVALASGTGGPAPTKNSSKAYATEQRTAVLEGTAGTLKTNVATQTTRVNNLSGNSTSTNNLSDSQVSGTSDNPATTGFVILTSGVQGATVSGSSVAQHTHSYGHIHGRGSYAVGNGNHAHSLPNV
jgi:hypothetical protein